MEGRTFAGRRLYLDDAYRFNSNKFCVFSFDHFVITLFVCPCRLCVVRYGFCNWCFINTEDIFVVFAMTD